MDVDDARNERWLRNFQIPGVPHVKLFGMGSKEPVEVKAWQNGATAEEIATKIGGALVNLIEKRTKKNRKAAQGPGADGEVVEVTEQSFRQMVQESEDTWALLIYEPYCKHC